MINFFDILVLIIVIGLTINGYREGLVRGAVKLVGFVITVIIISAMSGTIIRWSGEINLLPPAIMVPVVFLIILIIGVTGFHLLAKLLHSLIHMTPAGFIDSGLGCAFGALKALMVSGLLAVALSLARPDTFLEMQFRTSNTGQPLIRLLSESVPLVKRAVHTLYRHITPSGNEPDKYENEKNIPDNII